MSIFSHISQPLQRKPNLVFSTQSGENHSPMTPVGRSRTISTTEFFLTSIRNPSLSEKLTFIPPNKGILCRTCDTFSKKCHNFKQHQILMPASLQNLLEEYRDSPSAGHLSYQRTKLRIQDKYYWQRMLENTKK